MRAAPSPRRRSAASTRAARAAAAATRARAAASARSRAAATSRRVRLPPATPATLPAGRLHPSTSLPLPCFFSEALEHRAMKELGKNHLGINLIEDPTCHGLSPSL